jgi:hypothetical protein
MGGLTFVLLLASFGWAVSLAGRTAVGVRFF